MQFNKYTYIHAYIHTYDSDDRAGLRGYVQFNKYTYIPGTYIHIYIHTYIYTLLYIITLITVHTKQHIFSLSMEMSRLTRDGTAEPVSRGQIPRRERGQGDIHFPCSADHVQDWQPYPVDPYSCYVCHHTYIT